MQNGVKIIMLALILMILFLGSQIQAQSLQPQVRGGYYSDLEKYFIGGGINIGLIVFSVVPNFEYVFVDEGSFYSLNVDGYYHILPLPVIAGYIGGGAGYAYTKPDGGESRSKLAINILGGVQTKMIPLKPFAQVKYAIISDMDNQLVLTIGIHF